MNKQEKQEARRLPVFYIALCCCVIAIGVAGYFTERNTSVSTTPDTKNGDSLNIPQSEIVSKEENTAIAVSEIVENTEDYTVTSDDVTVTEANDIPVLLPDDTIPEPFNEPAQETALIVTNPEFLMPVTGDILEEFSKELTYNNALCDWRAHTGVDISAPIGASVLSIHDGTVTKISSDEMGKYIEIDHGNGFVARYCRLSSTEGCEVGKEIKAGEVIGTICEGDGENVNAPHLHLELLKDSEPVNPMEYIKQ